MTATLDDELIYHLRELRADLGLVRLDIETAAAGGADRSVVQAWVQAEALLDHDLEVHVPRALALLGVAVAAQVHTRTAGAQGSGDREQMAAEAAGRRVGAALMALGDEPVPQAARVISAAGQIEAAHRIVAAALEEVIRSAAPPSH